MNLVKVENTQNYQVEIKLDLLDNIEKVLLKGDELHQMMHKRTISIILEVVSLY